MSRNFPIVDPDSDTFYSWAGKTNDMRIAYGNTVTTAANSTGDLTAGNAYVTGVFGANVLATSTLKGGNVQSNAAILITSNVNIGNSSWTVITTQANVATVMSSSFDTSSTSTVTLDEFEASSYRSGKYLISIKEKDSLYYQSTEIMILHDGTNVYTTEYATLLSSSTLAVFTSDINSGNVRIRVTPTTQNNTIKFQRTLMTV